MNITGSCALRRALLPVLSLSLFFLFSCSAAKKPVNAGADGIAIKGYDTVAYFSMGKPVKGSKEFSHQWKGATWLFANREHRDLFAAAPEEYAPQYGGY